MQHLTLMGPVRVEQMEICDNKRIKRSDDDSPPRFRSRRTVALLGYLAVEQRPVAREHLARLFWPDEEPSIGRTNLRRELYNLAKILPDCWIAGPQTITFIPSTETTVDIYMLPQLEETRRWQDAAVLLTGEFLEGIHLSNNFAFENWLSTERERWQSWSEVILTHACHEQIGRGQYAQALHLSQRLLRYAPWNEGAQRMVMRLLMWTNQRAAALRQFELCREILAAELAIEPAKETIELHRQIKFRELRSPPNPPAFMQPNSPKCEYSLPVFVERERQLNILTKFRDDALAGKGRVVFVTGGPGRGKTALMNAFARQSMNKIPGLLIARGVCTAYSGAGDPYSPFRDVLAMLTGDIESRWSAGTISSEHARRLWSTLPIVIPLILTHSPQLLDVLVASTPLITRARTTELANTHWVERLEKRVKRQRDESNKTEQVHVYEQFTKLLQALAERHPLILFIDDMQWMDVASIRLLFHLGRRLAETSCKILIVCAYRPNEILVDVKAASHPLAKLLSEFKRTFGDVWLSLNWQDDSEGQRFVNAIVDSEPNQLTTAFRNTLFRRTGGHPLFTVELLHAMESRGDLIREKGQWFESTELDWNSLPARVEAVIDERIRQIEPELQQILAGACVEGKIFTAQVVASMQSMDEGMILRCLAQDLERKYRLVKEHEVTGTSRRTIVRYRFGHDLFQEFLYQRLSQGERQAAHKLVAAELEKLYSEELQDVAAQLAHHHAQANDYDNALRYFVMAADQASAIYANDQALTHYNRAIALLQTVPADATTIATLHRKRGIAFRTTGSFAEARQDFEIALTNSQAASEPRIECQVLTDLGKLWASRNYERALGFFESALRIARQLDDAVVLGSSLNWMGNWHANHEEPAIALSYHREAMHLFENAQDKPNMAKTLDLLGITYLLGGNFEESVAHYNQSIALFQTLGDLPNLASSLMGRAVTATAPAFLTLVPAARVGDPFADFQEAIEIAQRIGSFPDEAWSAWPRGLLFALQGDFGQALETSRRGLQIASEIEHREWLVGNQFVLGILFTELLAPEAARLELEQCLVLAKELDSKYWINHVSGALARAYIRLDQLPEAQNCLSIVLSNDTLMDTKGKRYCWVARVELDLALGKASKALKGIEELILTAEGRRSGDIVTYLWLLKARAYGKLGHAEEALQLLQEAVADDCTSGDCFLSWRLHVDLAHFLKIVGREKEARQVARLAHDLIIELAATISDVSIRRNFRRRALRMV